MTDIREKLNEYQKNMLVTLDDLDVNTIISDGISIRIGNKLYQLTATKEEPLEIEEQIRREFQTKITLKLAKIGETIKAKMAEVSGMVSSFTEEYERKELLMKDTLAKSAPMPQVSWAHAKRGLSIVKGDGRGEIFWLVKKLYNPKLVDNDVIEPLYIKKLMTNIYIVIRTTDKKVVGVSTRYMNSLEYFDHYHQARPDCWGNWKWPANWETADDILNIADQAIGVLGKINTMSIANRAPSLMPRLETLRKHVTRSKDALGKDIKVDVATARESVSPTGPMNDSWGN